ncbi:MAG: peptide chain release factor 2, partial [Myxococcota bacterium]
MAKTQDVQLKDELQRQADQLLEQWQKLCTTQQMNQWQTDIKRLDEQIQQEGFWQNPKQAAAIQQERTRTHKLLQRAQKTQQLLADCKELLDLLGEQDALQEVQQDIQQAEKLITGIRLQQLLQDPNDINDAILTVNTGQGGVDAQDFAQMLLRMYQRYAQRQRYQVQLADMQEGDEAGIKSATLLISGEYAYGYLKAEVGVHRLVRISPFDAGGRRHTSFAAVWVLPQIDDSVEVDIQPQHLRVDTFRAGGAGGQHQNKTDSAVRMTHEPTGIAVVCRSERSQIQNRATAMKMLRARLYEHELQKRLEQKNRAEAAKREASFGSQIRNYVLAPYRLAKDLRTNHEIGNVEGVLDGDLQPFIEAYLL